MSADKQPLRVRLEPGGTVTIAPGKVELGQGILTALAQIAAEELGVELSKIKVLPASTAYSPDEGVTSGSLSIQEGGKALRAACAELRGMQPKAAADYRIVGTNAPRLDLPGKIAGKPSYVHDMVLPGMLHARIVRPAKSFSKLSSLKKEGVHAEIVQDGSFVGVLADTEVEAIAAAKKLAAGARWEDGPAWPEDWTSFLKSHVTKTEVSREQSDPAAKGRGTKQLRAAYAKPLIAHASIGPSCAVARLKDGKLEVWTHSQGIFNLRRELAMVLRMKEEDIVVTHAEGAGCYGHNGADDVALDAALLARAANGRPVRLQWTREDEFAWEPYGPAMAFSLAADLDAEGSIVSWRHEFWSNGHTHRPGRSDKATMRAAAQIANAVEVGPAIDPPLPAGGSDRNAIPLYDFPDLKVEKHWVKEMPVRGSSLRSLGGFGNVFAIESFMDELAAAAQSDPVSFRLKHLKDPRARAVIEEVVRKSNFSSWKKTEAKGHGLAFAKYKNLGAYCAVVAEVEAGGKDLRVTRLVVAVDAGLAVNPDGLVNQVEGGAIQAASWTLKEEVKPGTLTWEDYPILRFSEVPAVEVHLIKNQNPSVGAGECAAGPTAAAIANALHDALGVRVRELPLTQERIVKAINA
jgi:CO/xanthine dehydrogenase Mo-binding subunit